MSAGRLRALYYNSASYASPTWVLMTRISDVNIARGKGTGDRAYRGAKTKKKVTGYLEYGITFKYAVKKGTPTVTDTLADKLEDSYINDTILDIAALNAVIGAGTTRKGIRGPYVVTKFDMNEGDEDSVTYDVELVEVEDEQPAGTPFETGAYTVTTA